MIKKLINYILELKITFLFNRKLKKIGKNVSNFSKDKNLESEYLNIWKKLKKKPSLNYPRYYSSINGIKSSFYVPENIYYGKIEPVLNNKAYVLAYTDKNFFERFLAEFRNLFPKAIVRGINGVIFNADYRRIKVNEAYSLLINNSVYILKPAIETSGGANVVLIKKIIEGIQVNNQFYDQKAFIQLLLEKYRGSFVIQEKINQHSWFEDFNQSSVNTVRLFTYRSVQDETVHPLHAVVRFGKPGSIVDNQAAGGLTCGISKNGRLNNFACEKYGKVFRDIPNIKDKESKEVPFFEEMKKLACRIAPNYGFHRFLGFDFCVDDQNVVRLLEINCKNIETSFLQMNNGPLFGEFTNEIIEYCQNHRKSVVLDFYI